MFTGEHSIGEGSITIAGYDVATQLEQVQARIGYVPQFDALIGYLNARELLTLYGGLRGVPPGLIPGMVDHLLTSLDLLRFADKPCKTYSGGNKRKLGVAVALMGDPEILLMYVAWRGGLVVKKPVPHCRDWLCVGIRKWIGVHDRLKPIFFGLAVWQFNSGIIL